MKNMATYLLLCLFEFCNSKLNLCVLKIIVYIINLKQLILYYLKSYISFFPGHCLLKCCIIKHISHLLILIEIITSLFKLDKFARLIQNKKLKKNGTFFVLLGLSLSCFLNLFYILIRFSGDIIIYFWEVDSHDNTFYSAPTITTESSQITSKSSN